MIAEVLSVAAYAVVVSQPLAYLVFLEDAQRALSAAAYIELRQRINSVMNERLPIVYGATLLTMALLLLVLLSSESTWFEVGAATAALVCLVVDIVVALRVSVPINQVMDRWTPADYAADWRDYRDRWFAVFRRRQLVLLAGFVVLVAGAVG